jgi:hypothetical protein
MKRRLDSIVIGGAMLFGGMAHRRAERVSRQVGELEEAVEAVEDHLRETEARSDAPRSDRPPIPGMPLPTGYGLQVRGPDDESIILPVCLPPGFELASMVLAPEFLPREEPQAAPAPIPVPAPAPARPRIVEPEPEPAIAAAPAPPARVPVRERLSGTLQYVFGSEPDYSVDESFGGAVEAEHPPRPARPSGIETHHL